MHTALTRFTVQQLRAAGVTQRVVSERTGVSERTVRRIEAEPVVTDLDDIQLRADRKVGRPSKTASFAPFVAAELEAQPDVMSLELLRRAKERGYSGGKTAFYELVKALRRKTPSFTMRFEGLPGEFSQHDFGTVIVRFIDGSRRKVKFFASRLKWSRFVVVSLVDDETAETLVRTLLEHFDVMGGIPARAVFDRPKTVAIEWTSDGRITKWNHIFQQAVLDIGFTPEVCWPYQPNQKGSVERIVGWVKSSFFKQRRFRDMDDLREQLDEWVRHVNHEVPSRATGIVPATRRDEERPRLRAPRVGPDEFAFRKPVSVGPTAYITFEAHQYALDAECAGRDGTLYVHRDRLRIVVDGRSFTYERQPEDGTRHTKPAQRTSHLKALTRRGKGYCRRQHLLDLGSAGEAFLTALCHREPSWESQVEVLHDLLQRHGDDALRRAFRAAVDVERCDLAYVLDLMGEPSEVAAK